MHILETEVLMEIQSREQIMNHRVTLQFQTVQEAKFDATEENLNKKARGKKKKLKKKSFHCLAFK